MKTMHVTLRRFAAGSAMGLGSVVLALAVSSLGVPVGHGPAAPHPPGTHGGPGPCRPSTSSALALADRFVVAWWTSAWDDRPTALAGRVADMAAPGLEASLSLPGSVAPVLGALTAGQRRRVTVTDPVAVVADRSGGGTDGSGGTAGPGGPADRDGLGASLGIAVTATATASAPGYQPVSGVVGLELLEVPGNCRWVVDRVDQ